jgi:long-chain acyl-CoA synthetase
VRLFDIIPYQCGKYPRADAISYKNEEGEWEAMSSEKVHQEINRVSKGLIKLGVEPGDKIAIVSQNRPEWTLVDLGVLQVGAVNVPVYPTISEADYAYILAHAAVKWAFVSDRELYQKVAAVAEQLPTLKGIYSFARLPKVSHWSEILTAEDGVGGELLDERIESVVASDLATIIYTSGTTGRPKGVMLSHENIVANVQSIVQLLPITHEHKALSFLPMCHIFERMVVYTYLYLGVGIYFEDQLEELREDLKTVRPHVFSTVPRLLEKLYEAIVNEGYQLKGLRRKLFFWALDLGLRYQLDIDQGWSYRRKLRFARRWVFRHWEEAMGGNIIGIVSGAAALPPYLCKVFCAAGIVVREGYGQTEGSPVIAFNRFEPGGAKEGTVGLPIPGVEVNILANGEICARGPNVMMGYYKEPQITAQTIDAEGWLHTGDVGRIVGGRFLQITDRIKEVFKTAGGKYVAPLPIEQEFRESPFIDQIMVVGEDRKFVGALIVPDFVQLDGWREKQGLPPLAPEDLLQQEVVQKHYQEIVASFNERFGKIEKIKQFRLLAEEWTVESGELTPTLKMKRKVIQKKHHEEIEAIYQSQPSSW